MTGGHGSDPGPLIRPYALTGGRTETSRADLEIEDLVTTTPHGLAIATALEPQHHQIAVLCASPISVAEVAARAGMPLGVTRILVGDLAEEDVVRVDHTDLATDGRPATGLLQRVLAGLQAMR